MSLSALSGVTFNIIVRSFVFGNMENVRNSSLVNSVLTVLSTGIIVNDDPVVLVVTGHLFQLRNYSTMMLSTGEISVTKLSCSNIPDIPIYRVKILF